MKQINSDVLSFLKEQHESMDSTWVRHSSVPTLDDIWNPTKVLLKNRIAEFIGNNISEEPSKGTILLNALYGFDTTPKETDLERTFFKMIKNSDLLLEDILLISYSILDQSLNQSTSQSPSQSPNQSPRQSFSQIKGNDADYSGLEDAFEFVNAKKERLTIAPDLFDISFIEEYSKCQNFLDGVSSYWSIDGKAHCVLLSPSCDNSLRSDDFKKLSETINDGFEKQQTMTNDWNALAAYSIVKKIAIEKDKNSLPIFEGPTFAFQYRKQMLKNAKQLPWGYKSDAAPYTQYSYNGSQTAWAKLFNDKLNSDCDPVSWYLFEQNTGFNLSLALFFTVYKNIDNSVFTQVADLLQDVSAYLAKSPLTIMRIRIVDGLLRELISSRLVITEPQKICFKNMLFNYSDYSEKISCAAEGFLVYLFEWFRKDNTSLNESCRAMRTWLKGQINSEIYSKCKGHIAPNISPIGKTAYLPSRVARRADNICFSKIYKIFYPACATLDLEHYKRIVDCYEESF